MMTVCAGRFTPHARVAVHTSTCEQAAGQQPRPSSAPHLDVLVGEQLFDQRAVLACHAGMVDGEAVRQQLLEVRVGNCLSLRLQQLAPS
jgi:hypothetical protein